MAEVRCPMCSKPNPEDSEVCEFCGARIKPLIIQQEPEGEPERQAIEPEAPSEEPQDEQRAETDWLNRMRFGVEGEQVDESEPDQDLTGPKRGETDLLGRFRDLGISEDEPEPISEEPQFRDEPEADFPEAVQEQEDLSTFDLQERLTVSSEDLEPVADVSEPEQELDLELPTPEEQVPDVSTDGIDETMVSDEEAVPDWLARIRARKEIDETSEPARTGDTDWLTGLREVTLTSEEQQDETIESDQDPFLIEDIESIDDMLDPLQPEEDLVDDPPKIEAIETDPDPFAFEDIETIDAMLEPQQLEEDGVDEETKLEAARLDDEPFFPEGFRSIDDVQETIQPEEVVAEDEPEQELPKSEETSASVDDFFSELDKLAVSESVDIPDAGPTEAESFVLDDPSGSIDDLISELDLLMEEEAEEEAPVDTPLVSDLEDSSPEQDLILEDLFSDLSQPSETDESPALDDELLADLDIALEDSSESPIPDSLFSELMDAPADVEPEGVSDELEGLRKSDLQEEETVLGADFFSELGIEVEPEVTEPVETIPSSDVSDPFADTAPPEEFPLLDGVQPTDADFLADLIEEPSEHVDFPPSPDVLPKEPELEDMSDLADELAISEPIESETPEGASLGEILSDFHPSWLDETVTSDRDQLPHVPALILDDELPPIEGVPSEGDTASMEIPSWLQDLGKDVEEELVEQDEDLQVLVKATLPPWLEAMRPLETFRTSPEIELEEEEEIVEAAGPLAGLKGVLLAEPVVAMPRTPIVTAGTLDISDRDYSQTEILQHMVEEEQTEEEGLGIKRMPFPIIRWITAALLVISVLVPSLFGFPDFTSPNRAPREFSPLLDIVQTIPHDKPALLVFDFEPSHFAEMDAVAGALVENLMALEQPIITLSTQPSGPLLADRMLRRVGTVHGSVNGEDYLHLGYLSGGPTAIQLFVTSPSGSRVSGFNLPEELEDIILWDFPLLQNVNHISDFALIVVISSGTEKARQWTEQVHPAIGETPLIMVVSTGTEPIVRPYYEAESKQIDGILSGLPSAMIYEGVNGLQADATHRWDGYGTSVLIAVIILFAGFGYAVFTWIKKRFLSRES